MSDVIKLRVQLNGAMDVDICMLRHQLRAEINATAVHSAQ